MKVSELRDEIQNNNLQVSRYKKINVAIALIIILYLLYQFLFGFDGYSNWFLFRMIIVLLVIILGLGYKGGAFGSSSSFPKLGKFIDSFLDFLSPQDPKEALKLLGIYAVLGIIILSLSLFGPWFRYDVDWTHSFADSWYEDEYGHLQSDRYGLYGVKSVYYDYWDWGDYTTSSEYKDYDDFNGFQNRQEVGLTTSYLVIIALTLWSISSIIGLYLINKNIINLDPKIKSLNETDQVQKRIVKFSNKLEYLHSKNINLSTFNKKIEEIGKIEFKKNNQQDDINLRFITYTYLTCCTIAIGIALAACILFSQNWVDAMHNENGGDDGICIVCENVDVFNGGFSDFGGEVTSSGTYYYDIWWHGGWGRGIVLWLGSLTFMGIFINSLALHNLTKASVKEIETLNKKSSEFKIPLSFSNFIEIYKD